VPIQRLGSLHAVQQIPSPRSFTVGLARFELATP
jgi:hypothetical protein